jgi:CDP-4-dehydro-6-deoxyglucose reductase
MVGCTTCANTCPADSIVFPPRQKVLELGKLPPVLRAVHEDLIARRAELDIKQQKLPES